MRGLPAAAAPRRDREAKNVDRGMLGKIYRDGEQVVRQGETGGSMFVIQSGKVRVLKEANDQELPLAVLEAGDVFGEMAIFNNEVRTATVRALGEARILTVDKRGFLRRIHEDPSFVFRILQKMSERIQALDAEVAALRQQNRGER
jgi:CRP-like cAMP-binding protein